MRFEWSDAVVLLGLGLVVSGIVLISVPAALIIGGMMIAFLGYQAGKS